MTGNAEHIPAAGQPAEPAQTAETDKGWQLLEQEKVTLLAEYAAARDAGEPLARFDPQLETLYWRCVEHVLESKAAQNPETLTFSDGQRLLIDFGLLDEAFVNDAAPGLSERLLAELRQQGLVNHFYLTEWLADRYQRFRVNLAIEAEPDPGDDDRSGSKFQLSRRKILEKLTPLLEGLQGVTPEATRALLSGRLDLQIISLGANLLNNRLRKELGVRHRLWEMRRQILSRARARTLDARELKFFDVLDNLYQMEWRSVYEELRSGNPMTSEERLEQKIRARRDASVRMMRKKASKYLMAELRFARSLFPLGALAGGVLRSMSVLTADGPRVTKADTARMLQNAALCDRNFTVTPVVLIAPFRGRGIYEWDRDSLVVGLTPAENPAESAANAAANYTMLIDSLQHGGNLKAVFKERFSKANFQRDFQTDYRRWLCDAAAGHPESLAPERLQFFKEFVGLDLTENPAVALAPQELRYLTPQARHIIRTQLRRQVQTAKDSPGARWRLGLLAWMDGDLEEALKEIPHAAKLAPEDVRLLTGVGLLLDEAGRTEQAAQIMQICIKRGKDNIWGLYAADALTRLQAAQ